MSIWILIFDIDQTQICSAEPHLEKKAGQGNHDDGAEYADRQRLKVGTQVQQD